MTRPPCCHLLISCSSIYSMTAPTYCTHIVQCQPLILAVRHGTSPANKHLVWEEPKCGVCVLHHKRNQLGCRSEARKSPLRDFGNVQSISPCLSACQSLPSLLVVLQERSKHCTIFTSLNGNIRKSHLQLCPIIIDLSSQTSMQMQDHVLM